MACFIVPATEAIATTLLSKVIKKKKQETEKTDVSFSNRLDRLNGLLWGGSGLLAFEHFWHGEIQLSPPFLTAAAESESARTMLYEMSTSGVAMAAVVTVTWAVSVIIEKIIKERDSKSTDFKEANS